MKYAIFEEKGKYCLRTATGGNDPWFVFRHQPGMKVIYETSIPEFFVSEWQRVDKILHQHVDQANQKGVKLDVGLLEKMVTQKEGGK
ncbi:MAG: hypothetical protein AABY26_00050 [Nanoarchaeota archaeon]